MAGSGVGDTKGECGRQMSSSQKEEDNDKKKNPLKMLEALSKDVINEFLDSVMEKNVLKVKEEDKQKYHGAKTQDKARVLVSSLRDKQEEAVRLLLETCLHLEGKPSNTEASPAIKAEPAESAEPTDTLKLCPYEDFLRLSKERAEEIYPIKEKNDRTRLALIICNTEFDHLAPRNGADHDIVGMKGLLEGLGYSVDVKEKLTARVRAPHPPQTHTYSTHILPLTTPTIPRNWIKCDWRVFSQFLLSSKNPVAASSSQSPENPVAASSSESPENLEEDAVRKAHVEKDFIAFCSSTPHNVSWRDVTKGSLFITQLITCFQKYSWCCHLQEVFRKVQQSFETPSVQAQMPTIERLSMTRCFYLFPGN
ncbi:PREDICTED: caspase-4-like [Propithecus coquereli]|uniref:caspase-4-like n=1 Tax=Propithecus coquereli TaxID=379532 RepID=UPI00063F1BCF|nr:PREDICTED: caspase-4-like [Propithecus coquereli]